MAICKNFAISAALAEFYSLRMLLVVGPHKTFGLYEAIFLHVQVGLKFNLSVIGDREDSGNAVTCRHARPFGLFCGAKSFDPKCLTRPCVWRAAATAAVRKFTVQYRRPDNGPAKG